jgi:hypothetical protein
MKHACGVMVLFALPFESGRLLEVVRH